MDLHILASPVYWEAIVRVITFVSNKPYRGVTIVKPNQPFKSLPVQSIIE